MENKNISDKKYWSEGGGYYQETPENLRNSPLPFPSLSKPSNRILEDYFNLYLPNNGNSRLLEIGCGGSKYLPYFHRKWGLDVTGIDYDEFAANLARANLEGHQVRGNIFCRDALDVARNCDLSGQFDVVFSSGVLEHFKDATAAVESFALYLRGEGLIITCIPNFHGINRFVQGLVDPGILDMHVLHTKESLQSAHELAGIRTLSCAYYGVYNGWLTESGRLEAGLRKGMHRMFCWGSNVVVDRIIKASGYRFLPETRWASPYILYVGRKRESSR